MTTFHKDQPPEECHGPAYFQNTDPGAIGPGKQWIDSDTGIIRTRNLADDGWVISGRQAAAQADSTATDTSEMIVDFNALLAKLRTAGILDT